MILVVSDTSPVRTLNHLGLPEIFTQIVIPTAVERELADPPKGQSHFTIQEYSFKRVQAPTDEEAVNRFLVELDAGESEALALALEIRADLILIDESAGRRLAKEAGLTTIGVLGILLEAKRRGFIGPLAPFLDSLQEDHRFFIAARIRSEVLRITGEVP